MQVPCSITFCINTRLDISTSDEKFSSLETTGHSSIDEGILADEKKDDISLSTVYSFNSIVVM